MKNFVFIVFLCSSIAAFGQSPVPLDCPITPTHVITDGTDIKIPPTTPGGPLDPIPFVPYEPEPNPVDRQVHWVHGLGGTSAAWQKPADATQTQVAGFEILYPARMVMSFRPTYNMQGDLPAAAADLAAMVNASGGLADAGITQPRSRTILIAHSLGGVVSRAAGDLGSPSFGGIATFGTPHSGAAIANNVVNGAAEAFSKDLCKDVLAGPHLGFGIYQAFPFGPLAPGPVGSVFFGLPFIPTPSAICGAVDQAIADFAPPIVSEIQVGSAALASLGGGNVDNKVVFAGVETDEVIWREFWHGARAPSKYALFDANDQARGQTWANRAKLFYQTNAVANSALGPIGWFRAARWLRGYHALRDANDKWKSLIGAVHVSAVTNVATCYCTTYNANGGVVDKWHTPGGSCPFTHSTNTTTNQTTICQTSSISINTTSSANDGLVNQSSQLAYPGAAFGRTMAGSNHQSMRNDENTRLCLIQLWTGGVGAPDFWRTPVR
jgi:pimeloyl-ACP methyl ester carboxylesterase